MASNRHLGRMSAVQTLYEYEFRTQVGDGSVDVKTILDRNIQKHKTLIGDLDFVTSLVNGVVKNQPQIDEKLAPLAPDWPIEQIGSIDRAVLRIGIYELLFAEEKTPHGVIINEAVDLAKEFGSDNSGKFVNGVLGAAYREFVEETDDTTNQKPAQ